MQHTSFRILLCVFLIAVSGCTFSKTSTSIAPTPKVACSKEQEPVCGVDGITYPNNCHATQRGISVAAKGPCVNQTQLNEYERKYLVWLLRQRKEADLPDVSIKHYRTTLQIQNCPDCYTLYYRWGQPEILARIIVENNQIISAIDSQGYDYLTRTQGTPQNFPVPKDRI